MLCVLFYNVLYFLLGKARIFSYCRNLNLRRLRADMGIKSGTGSSQKIRRNILPFYSGMSFQKLIQIFLNSFFQFRIGVRIVKAS